MCRFLQVLRSEAESWFSVYAEGWREGGFGSRLDRSLSRLPVPSASSCVTLQRQNGLSQSKSGSDVEINNATQVLRGHEKVYYSQNQTF